MTDIDLTKFTTTERSTVIAAPASAVVPLLTDFTAWKDWSPWEGADPAMTRTYEGTQGSVGAYYAWSGNRKAGAGHMTITDITPATVKVDLDFTRPFKTSSKVVYGLAETGDVTKVTWTMYSPKNLISKIMGIFMDFDKMVGADFDRGLAKLKGLAEAK